MYAERLWPVVGSLHLAGMNHGQYGTPGSRAHIIQKACH